jgi:hypothetical protein
MTNHPSNHAGLRAFSFHINLLEQLLLKATRQKNPALYVYKQGGRTTLFMLEGLAKLYAGVLQKKRFAKMKERFKVLEDALGSIDYYDVLAQELKSMARIPKPLVQYAEAQKREKIQYLQEVLLEGGWLGEPSKRLEKIRAKLEETRWLEPAEEAAAVKDFYGEAVYSIKQFLRGEGNTFNDIEHDVHELRRQLRWLSIYPQALRGMIQLGNEAATTSTQAVFKKYHTAAITQSPFNQMPPVGDASFILLLDKNRFLCLSWTIAELGRLKDQGLREVGLAEALLETGSAADEAQAHQQALKLLGKKQIPISGLLEQASASTLQFQEEQHLEYLVMGTARVVPA